LAIFVTNEKLNPSVSLATPMALEDTSYASSSQKVEQNSPSGEMEKYFHSVKQLRKPTPGLYKDCKLSLNIFGTCILPSS
jgi:hypothetical protein